MGCVGGLRRGQCDGVGRVECLDTSLVVTVERRGTATRKAELVILRISEPHPDSVQVHADAFAIHQCRRERLLHDQTEFGVAGALAVRAEVADILSCAKWRPRLFQQKDRVVTVGRDVAGLDVEVVETPRVRRERHVHLHVRVWHALSKLLGRRRQLQVNSVSGSGDLLEVVVDLSRVLVISVPSGPAGGRGAKYSRCRGGNGKDGGGADQQSIVNTHGVFSFMEGAGCAACCTRISRSRPAWWRRISRRITNLAVLAKPKRRWRVVLL